MKPPALATLLLVVCLFAAACSGSPGPGIEGLFERSMTAMHELESFRMVGTFKASGLVELAWSGDRAQLKSRNSGGDSVLIQAPPYTYHLKPGDVDWQRTDLVESESSGVIAFFLLFSILLYPDSEVPLGFYELSSRGTEELDGLKVNRISLRADWPGIMAWLEDEEKLAGISARLTGQSVAEFKADYLEITNGLNRPLKVWIDDDGLLRQLSGRFIEGFTHEDAFRFYDFNQTILIEEPTNIQAAIPDGGPDVAPTVTPAAPPVPVPVPTATPAPVPEAPVATQTPDPTPTPTPAPTVTPQPTPTPPVPSISISNPNAPGGAPVIVTGSGFQPGVKITITYHGFGGGESAEYDMAFVATDQLGAFAAGFAMPNLPYRDSLNRIAAQSETGAFAWVDHTFLTPTLEMSTPQAKSGVAIIAAGRGFTPNFPVTLFFDQTALTTVPLPRTNDQGAIDLDFKLPGLQSGDGKMKMTVGGESAVADFQVLPPRITLARRAESPNSIFVEGSGFAAESTVTVSGGGITVGSAKVTSDIGGFSFEMDFRRDVRSEDLTITANTGLAEASAIIFASASRS